MSNRHVAPVAIWSEPASRRRQIAGFLRFAEQDGRLVLSDQPGDAAEAYMIDDGTGRLVLEDEVSSGLRMLSTTRINAF